MSRRIAWMSCRLARKADRCRVLVGARYAIQSPRACQTRTAGRAPAEVAAPSSQSEGDDAWADPTEAGAGAEHADRIAEQQAERGPAPAAGPSTIRIDVRAAGEPIAADIRILDGEDVVASGAAGEPITAYLSSVKSRSETVHCRCAAFGHWTIAQPSGDRRLRPSHPGRTGSLG